VRPKLMAFSLFLCATGVSAQSSQDKAQVRNDLAANDQIKAIADQQKQILSTLTEIKELLAANAPRPTPQPPAPPSALATQDEAFRGDSGAMVAIVEYADFQCPYCGQYEHEVYPHILSDYIETGKVKYFYRDLALPMHPYAIGAARAAHCAGEQGKYWEMHDSLFARQNAIRDADMPGRAEKLGLDNAKFSECLSSDRYTGEIKQRAMEAQKMGISGTPTFFIGTASPDGEVTNVKMIVGAVPYDAFKAAIEDTLAAKK
jgi:protein-disulfide isomerase